ncbi:MAG: ComEA family DNA-binding protein [Steroidobacteraceae bacterium]|nr:ComEA family DNA-binding protein [Steroidobacteraceae bacterium]MDW8259699.1 ComEA family DNA-binding protein [Gammaproteobacteria bacterium]
MLRIVAALLTLLPLAAAAQSVNINSADAATLARELKGIGLAKAEAIVAHRQKNGPFRSVDELGLVKGIGPRLIELNRALIRIEPVRAAPPGAARQAVPAPPMRKPSDR